MRQSVSVTANGLALVCPRTDQICGQSILRILKNDVFNPGHGTISSDLSVWMVLISSTAKEIPRVSSRLWMFLAEKGCVVTLAILGNCALRHIELGCLLTANSVLIYGTHSPHYHAVSS